MKSRQKKNLSFWCASLLLAACASKLPRLEDRALYDARNHQAFCREQGITSQQVAVGDSLLALAEAAEKSSDKREVFWKADLASLYYKIGIARRALQSREGLLANLKKDLQEEEKRLLSLQEIYREIKALRAP